MPALRNKLFISLFVLIAFWFTIIGLRATGHFPAGIQEWTTQASHDIASTFTSDDGAIADAATNLAALLQNVKEREAALEAREKTLRLESAKLAAMTRTSHPKSLISYVYTEGTTNRRNLKFFIEHGLHNSSHFVFTFNGNTDAHLLLPIYKESPYYNPNVTLSNIEVLFRDNKCYDMGAHGEALLREWDAPTQTWTKMTGHDRGGRKYWEAFERFILMNASIRGPFMPVWSRSCWADAFWGLVSEKKKLVAMTYNCHEDKGHAQSMVWATDRVGVGLLMQPPRDDGENGGIGYWCPYDMPEAIKGEVRATPLMRGAGFEVEALNLVYHSKDGVDWDEDGRPDNSAKGFTEGCTDEDYWHENAYYGFNLHPYETVFVKAARDMQEALIGNFTEWTDGSGYSSYERCDNGGSIWLGEPMPVEKVRNGTELVV